MSDENKSKLPPNVGALADAMIELLIKYHMGDAFARINASFDADTINDVAMGVKGDINLQLGLAFFSDALRQWQIGATLARMFDKEHTADISAWNRDAYRAAECFRRCGAKCVLIDKDGSEVKLTR